MDDHAEQEDLNPMGDAKYTYSVDGVGYDFDPRCDPSDMRSLVRAAAVDYYTHCEQGPNSWPCGIVVYCDDLQVAAGHVDCDVEARFRIGLRLNREQLENMFAADQERFAGPTPIAALDAYGGDVVPVVNGKVFAHLIYCPDDDVDGWVSSGRAYQAYKRFINSRPF